MQQSRTTTSEQTRHSLAYKLVLVRELSQLHQLFKAHQLKTGKLFYFSREDITVSNTITQKRFTRGNQHLVIFAEAFLIPYLISLWAPIKLIY